ncbi:FBP domain-containing protein [Amycolatopsis sp. NBC_00345]
MPRDLATWPWGDLDFLGRRDPAVPDRAYLVTESGDELVGITMRRATPPAGTPRSKAGKAGQQGNSVGSCFCTDLACSRYLRGNSSTPRTACCRTGCPQRRGGASPTRISR